MLNTENMTSDSKRQTPKKTQRTSRRAYKARRRYRMEVINENTLGRIFSLKLSRTKAVIVAVAAVAATISLVAVVFTFTPIGNFLPGQLKGNLREQYLETALRIDSLERITREQNAYTRNIVNILSDNIDSTNISTSESLLTDLSIDSLITSSEDERRFVRQFEEAERFNLSVLSPIAAEGMIFEAPTDSDEGIGEISSVYRGTVIGISTDFNGTLSITIQHPNDFISVYNNLEQTYVEKGSKVTIGQRIGRTKKSKPLSFELWHSGSLLNPSHYISY